MLRFLPFSALDLTRYAACVAAASPAAPPYVQAWWLAATAGRWAAVVELGPAGEYRSVLPLPRKWRPGGWRAYQPHFTQQLALVLTPASQHRDLAEYLALAARPCARLHVQLAVGTALPAALPPGFVATERTTFHLDLGPDYATLLRGYAPDYRRRLRRHAEQAAPPVPNELTDLEELIALFLAYRGPAQTGLRPRHYAALRRVVAAAQAQELAELRQLRHPATGELLAGAVFVRHAGGLIYLFAAASEAGRAAHAPLLLLDEAVRRHAGQPGQILDFEGGNMPAIGRFFANFGARPVSYPALTYSRPTWLPSWMRF